MRWIFDEDTDAERDLVTRILPRQEAGPDGELMWPGYNVDIEVANLPEGSTPYVTAKGQRFDTTIEHPARLVMMDWDGWVPTFALLDENYEPTGDFVQIPNSDDVTIRVG